ncbi:MAG: hypothetical protein WCT12_16225 [Verrucomicrobiota bacterium]
MKSNSSWLRVGDNRLILQSLPHDSGLGFRSLVAELTDGRLDLRFQPAE